MEQMLFLQYLLFGLGALAILALAVPLLIWRNTSETARLLADLLEEQEQTNALLTRLLRGMNALEQHELAAPGPDDDYGPDEEYCPDPEDAAYEPCAPEGESLTDAGPDDESETKDGPEGKGRFWLE
ncbi:YebO family protein [Paucidesulfovibrio longus]|uniref:hypothetical protein n=1 Tax=Paucidesulfovibrio longus TaxID=889 RepID=UPI0003B456B0|nr:hypothetical protein [Paucidesulfovibrio longus]